MGYRTEIEIYSRELGSEEWGCKVVQHTPAQFAIVDWFNGDDPELNETTTITIITSHIDRMIDALKAIKVMSEGEI